MAEVSIIILSWNTKDILSECLDAVKQYCDGTDYEVIVVDNGSTDGSQDMILSRYPQVRLIQNKENSGFAKANNLAMKTCDSSLMLLLNSDALLTEGSLQSLVELAHHQSRAGIIGALLTNPDGSFQASHSPFPNLRQEFLILSGLGRLVKGRWYPSRTAETQIGAQMVDYVEGACLLVRRSALEEVGGLCEDYFMYAEEVDWCFRMKERGWQVWYQPEARVAHYGGASSKNRKTAREGDLYFSRILFFKKHRGNTAAFFLKWMILGFTAIKYAMYKLIWVLSRGKIGRPVIAPASLLERFQGV